MSVKMKMMYFENNTDTHTVEVEDLVWWMENTFT